MVTTILPAYAYIRQRVITKRCEGVTEMAQETSEQQPNVSKGRKMGVGIAIGVAVGAGVGVAMGNIAMGVALGVGIGTAIGAGLSNQGK
jgi:Flp pilus assembly protein TadB